jgi:dolichol kinase
MIVASLSEAFVEDDNIVMPLTAALTFIACVVYMEN